MNPEVGLDSRLPLTTLYQSPNVLHHLQEVKLVVVVLLGGGGGPHPGSPGPLRTGSGGAYEGTLQPAPPRTPDIKPST